jgi:tRNA dimethylallyltransferase
METDQALYLAGQTATGKTSIALELARRIPRTEVINADAFQVYRGMEILAASPSESERDFCPHHLFGILSPSEECDVASFATHAKSAIADVLSRGGFPLVVGGSGLYLKAITHGLAPTPKGDQALRGELEKLSMEELVKRYEAIDPVGARATNLQNRRYVTRNLEISLLSGQPASEIKQRWENESPDIQAVFLKRQRADIYDRINRRTAIMFEQGVLEEFDALPELSTTAAKAIGIRELREYRAGEIDLETCQEEIRKITRRYAKRQESWFRREPAFLPIELTEESEPEEIAEHILATVG